MREIATVLYEKAMDMDYMDYEETREETIDDLEYALYWLKTTAENPYNYKFLALFWVIKLIAEH